jgi:MOSC domain-containing protein YiiM
VSDTGRIVQISVSNGGVPKRRVDDAGVTTLGVEGDAHRDLEHHGGPERAVCLYSAEAIRGLVGEGHAVVPGMLGENVTVEGIDWETLSPGTHLRLGDRVLLQITRYTTPCFNIKRAFKDGEFSRVSQKRHPGWSRLYARVLVEGRIRSGDPVRIVDEIAAAEHAAVCGRTPDSAWSPGPSHRMS